MILKSSELILNPDGSVYHLNLKPENLASTVITVGDPDRVGAITQHFDTVEFQTKNREFHTQTGRYKGKRISVISTGIGTDNIDIVLNELDALVNIDLEKRQIKEQLTTLDIVRIGTSGSIQKQIPVNSFLISDYAIGFDSLMHFYNSESIQHKEISDALVNHTQWSDVKSKPYVVRGDQGLFEKFSSEKTVRGFTATNVGFYGPQGRVLRLSLQDPHLNNKLASFNFNNMPITNFEMETAGIYGMSALLGHRALSLNAIIANRATGEFTMDTKKVVNDLIVYALEKLVSLAHE